MAVNFLILALAVFRIALMFSKEQGPCALFSGFRERICRRYACLRDGAECFWCWSVSISIMVSALAWQWPQLTQSVMLPFALSGAAVIFNQQWTTGNSNEK